MLKAASVKKNRTPLFALILQNVAGTAAGWYNSGGMSIIVR